MFSWDSVTVVAVVYAGVEIIGIAVALRAIMTARTSQGAVAWAIGLITFPWVALPLYGIFGGRRFRGYVAARRRGDEEIHRLLPRIGTSCSGGLAEQFPEFSGQIRAAERLAEMSFISNNQVRLLINGNETFDAMFSGIASARDYLLLEFYIIRDDELGRELRDRLTDKLSEGVRVFLLYDRIGSQSLPRRYLAPLIAAGAETAPFVSSRNPMRRLQVNFRNHRKILVVDGKTAFVGGHNVGNEYLGSHAKLSPWRDTHVEVRGPAALAVQLAFVEDWYWAKEHLPDLNWSEQQGQQGEIPVLVLPSGPADEIETCGLFVLHAINSARRRLWITSPYFVPDEAVVAALQLAAIRGVDVRVMLPAKADNWLVHLAGFAYIPEARKAGVRLFRYRAGFLHQKVMLMDDVGIVGTANLDNRSFRLNFEMTLVFADAAFAAEVAGMLERDFAQCGEISETDVRRLPFLTCISASTARLFAPVL